MWCSQTIAGVHNCICDIQKNPMHLDAQSMTWIASSSVLFIGSISTRTRAINPQPNITGHDYLLCTNVSLTVTLPQHTHHYGSSCHHSQGMDSPSAIRYYYANCTGVKALWLADVQQRLGVYAPNNVSQKEKDNVSPQAWMLWEWIYLYSIFLPWWEAVMTDSGEYIQWVYVLVCGCVNHHHQLEVCLVIPHT